MIPLISQSEVIAIASQYATWSTIKLVGAFLFGLFGISLLVPFFAPMFPRGLKETFGRILFTMGQMANGGGVLDRRDTGAYEMAPVKAEDGTDYIYRDGEWVELAGHAEQWTRFGLAPFAVTYEKTENAWHEFTADDPVPDEVPPDRVADGGDIVLFENQRADVPEFAPFATEPDEGFVISLSKVVERLRGAGGPELVNRSEEQVLEEEGGSNRMNPKYKVFAMVLAVLFGSVSAVFYFGGV